MTVYQIASDEDIERVFGAAVNGKKDGVLQSPSHLLSLLSEVGLPLSLRAAHTFFDKYDVDHSRSLDLGEVKAIVRAYEREMSAQFTLCDLNGDGFLDRSETRAVMRRFDIQVTTQQIDELFDQSDINHDGKLSFAEFVLAAHDLIEFKPREVIAQLFHLEPRLPANVTDTQVVLAGIAAGAVSRTMTAPFDRLRGLLAAGGTKTLEGVKGRPSVLQGLQAMYKAGGVRSFFQGNGMNVLQVGPESALTFLIYAKIATLVARDPANTTGFEKFLGGGIAGAIAMTLVYPAYTMQNRMVVAPEGHYKGIVDCFSKTVRMEGWAALAKGYTPSLVRVLPLRGIDMGLFNTLKQMFVTDGHTITVPQSLAFGGFTAAVSQSVTYPLMLCRTRLQTQGAASGRPSIYTGMVDCLTKTWAEEGARGLYAGLVPCLMKMVPAVAISFAVYEGSVREMQKRQIGT